MLMIDSIIYVARCDDSRWSRNFMSTFKISTHMSFSVLKDE